MRHADACARSEHPAKRCWSKLRQHLVGTSVVAHIVVLTAPLWYPLEDFVSVAAQWFAVRAETSPDTRHSLAGLAVVKIDAQRFADPAIYGGSSPLNRCWLARDLRRVLDHPGLRTVAVDLDLSPTSQACPAKPESRPFAKRPGSAADRPCECQRQLDALLEQHASRLVLMQPETGPHEETARRIEDWAQRLAAKGITFADPEVNVTHGIVREHHTRTEPDDLLRLGDAIRQHRKAAAPEHAKRSAAEAERPAPEIGEETASRSVIAFQSLLFMFRRGQALSPDDDCFGAGKAGCLLDTAIFGAGYSNDDRFETALGPLHGVDIHAAVAACEVGSRTGDQVGHLLSYGVELLVGTLLFGPLLGALWSGYFRAMTPRGVQRHPPPCPKLDCWERLSAALARWIPPGPDAAYLWLILLFVFVVVAALLLTVGLPLAWTSLSADACHVHRIPAAFLLGLTIEAAVVQGTEVATHLVSGEHDAGQGHKPGPVLSGHAAVRWLLYWGLFGAAMCLMLGH